MQDKIDFSSLERFSPKEDSFAKVLYRLELKQKRLVLLTKYTRIALAASLVFMVSGLFFPKVFSVSQEVIEENFEEVFDYEEDIFAFEFETLDSSLSISYILTEDK